MSGTEHDADRIPVVIASGQTIERTELVTPVDLMARACEHAFENAPRLRGRVDRLSVVNVMSRVGPAPATEVARRTGMTPRRCEVTTVGGNTPQWLVNRAASDIASGALSVTVIAGAEAIRSSRGRRAAGLPRYEVADLPEDPVVGDDHPGIGPGESAIGLMAPAHVYPLFESIVAARAGHSATQHRHVIGDLFAPFTTVAARNPIAWFPQERSAAEIATPTPENRIIAEPYTKLMNAFLGSDQGAALVVCSLAAARQAGVEDRAVFVWSGAEAVDVRFPTARSDPGRSLGIAAAGRALFEAASAESAASVGIDDVALIDLYSCFPSAVEVGADALGLSTDDPRGLTVTGGLPYFGGPGNNYTTHSIATLTDLLRDGAAGSEGTAGSDRHPTLGLATGLGWFITKHALGLYGTSPPPGGFRRGDTAADQAVIDASAKDVALELEVPTTATIVAATVIRDHDGAATAAPVIASLPDGRHLAAAPADADVLAAMSDADVPGMVGTQIAVEGGPPRYRLAGT